MADLLTLAAPGLDTVVGAYRLGLVGPQEVADLLVSKSSAGLPLTEVEKTIAMSLREQSDEVEALLGQQPESDHSSDVTLLTASEVAVERSWDDIPEPFFVLSSLLTQWGGRGARDLAEILPKGFDKWFLGWGAQARVRRRLASIILRRQAAFPLI